MAREKFKRADYDLDNNIKHFDSKIKKLKVNLKVLRVI